MSENTVEFTAIVAILQFIAGEVGSCTALRMTCWRKFSSSFPIAARREGGRLMFDLGLDEVVLTTVVAIVAIGPKELPRALRLAGYWVGRFRRMSRAFHAGVDAMIREAEIKELEASWSKGQDEILAHYAELERQQNGKVAAPSLIQPDLSSHSDGVTVQGLAAEDQGTIQSPSATIPPGALASNLTT